MSSLKDLKAMGAFVPDAPIKKEIKFRLDDGEERTAEIFVKRLNIGEYESLFLTDTEERGRTAKMIAEGIRLGEKGEERLTFQQAYKLHPSLAGAMVVAFNEVNTPKKTSPQENASSAT
jgi:hypothetical protein